MELACVYKMVDGDDFSYLSWRKLLWKHLKEIKKKVIEKQFNRTMIVVVQKLRKMQRARKKRKKGFSPYVLL